MGTVGKQTLCWVVAAVVGLSVAGALLAKPVGIPALTRPLLIVASTGFVAIALIGGGLAHRFGRFMVLGLVLCGLGDLLGPIDFTLGAMMFLLAHLAFIRAFAIHGVEGRRALRSLGLCIPISIVVLAWLLPHAEGGDRVLVISYTCVITAMLVLAMGMWAGSPRRLIIAGVVLFYISDVFVARWAFVGGGSLNAILCYPLYYGACLLLGRSASFETNSGSGA